MKASTHFHNSVIRRFIPLGLFLSLAISAAITARADFDAGLDAYAKEDFDAAFREWLPAAKGGDPNSQQMLGFLYARGRGVEKNVPEAVKWWRKAAEQGHAPAQFTLGNLYRNGIGIAKDEKEAVKWITRAADGGFADAQYLLGILHARGEGVERDLVKSYMYLDMAAEQKGLEPGALWGAITPYLSPAEIREAGRLIKKWRDKP